VLVDWSDEPNKQKGISKSWRYVRKTVGCEAFTLANTVFLYKKRAPFPLSYFSQVSLYIRKGSFIKFIKNIVEDMIKEVFVILDKFILTLL